MTRKEVKIILQCRGNGYSEDEFNEALEIAYSTLDSSLPSNLDEAAGNYAIEVVPDRFVPDEGNGYKAAYTLQDIKVAFKAGAEQMAGQGVILNISIDELSCGAYNACVEQGLTSEDDVIVQIRKKKA